MSTAGKQWASRNIQSQMSTVLSTDEFVVATASVDNTHENTGNLSKITVVQLIKLFLCICDAMDLTRMQKNPVYILNQSPIFSQCQGEYGPFCIVCGWIEKHD